MFLFWIVQAEVPVEKVVALSRHLSKQSWFAGMRIHDDNFPQGVATIVIRISSKGKFPSRAFSMLFDGKAGTFQKADIFHTPYNEDTWEPAHISRNTHRRGIQPGITKLSRKGVLILGRDVGEYLLELMIIKKFLVSKGYKHATLLKLKDDIPNLSLSQKLMLWGLLCRFSIIVDRMPAGHLNEFEMLKSQDCIIAILRPKGYRSTFMMDSHPQSRLIRAFEFERSPLERMPDVIVWAETIAKKNEEYYSREYDWRKV